MNLDVLKRFPNQNSEKRAEECVGETVADIIGNISEQPCDAGFSYAAALRVNNSVPTTAGSNPYAGMLGGLIYGALPTEKVPFDVSVMNELYEANWNNYTPESKMLANTYTQNGVTILKSYQDVVNCVNSGMPVCLALRWYKSFFASNSDGVLPWPEGQMFNHCVGIFEATEKGLRTKAWLGPDFADGGYAYLPQDVFNQVFYSAYAFNPRGWRWLNLASTAVIRPWLISDILPQLKS